ncbi:MAG: hypothetical protein KUG58_07130 [Marinosulfonomonas sp.]|nr:hypothetical protein [Marinosulfonomonas sp.]
MAKNLKDAIERNRIAAEELDRALRDCLAVVADEPKIVAEGRFRVFTGGRAVRAGSQ